VARRRRTGQAPSLALTVWRLHQAAEAGSEVAARRLGKLGWSGIRAGSCSIDVALGWHHHPDVPGECWDELCPESHDGEAWAANWEAYWPPGAPEPVR
jgi:hypothetical protein